MPPAIPPRVAAILNPLGTSLRAVLELDVSGRSVVVIGCGPIGLFAVASTKALGACQIIGLDICEERLVLAKRLGCDMTLNPRHADPARQIMEATDGVGADAIVEASGNETALEGALKFLRKGGWYALVGLPSGPVRLNVGPNVVFKEAMIIRVHGREMFRTWKRMKQLLAGGVLHLHPIATHEMPLEDYAERLALLETGKGSKVILIP